MKTVELTESNATLALETSRAQADNNIAIDKRFVFHDHLSLQLEADVSPFSVMIHFEWPDL